MGLLSGAYTDYAYETGSKYTRYGSGSSSYGSSARVNSTAATRSKIMQTVKDLAQGYSADLDTVSYYLKEGEIDSALDLKQSIFQDIKTTLSEEYNFNVTDKNIISMLDQAYESVCSETMLETVKNNADGSVETGLKQAVPILGLFENGTSEAEAVAQLTNRKVSGKEEAKEFFSKYAPGVLAIAGGVAAAGGVASAAGGIAGTAAWLGGLIVGGTVAAPALLAIGTTAVIAAGVISIGQNIIRDGIA